MTVSTCSRTMSSNDDRAIANVLAGPPARMISTDQHFCLPPTYLHSTSGAWGSGANCTRANSLVHGVGYGELIEAVSCTPYLQVKSDLSFLVSAPDFDDPALLDLQMAPVEQNHLDPSFGESLYWTVESNPGPGYRYLR